MNDAPFVPSIRVDLFLGELTALSRKHRLAFAGSATLFEMEPDDFRTEYVSDNESVVTFGKSASQGDRGGERDMRKVAEALGFEPDNHHNAAVCPYCTEGGKFKLVPAISAPVDGARVVLHLDPRPDGGLRISSPTNPGLILSDGNSETACLRIWPAIRALTSKEG